jgi:large subunit ribosomal protein L21
MYAVIATGGKQYRVQEGDILDIEKIDAETGAVIEFPEVLSVGDGADIQCGNPTLESASVEAEVIDHFRGKKLVVFKMKRRKGYRKKHGHRQELTKIQITKIAQ